MSETRRTGTTLAEAASQYVSGLSEPGDDTASFNEAFKAGAAWQRERDADICGAEARRYMEHPPLPGHAAAAKGCAVRIVEQS